MTNDPMELVSEFHSVYSLPNRVDAHQPATLDFDRLHMRMNLIGEEFTELVTAVYGEEAGRAISEARAKARDLDDHTRDLVETADALGDLVYVVYGMALEAGIDLPAVLGEIQRSNLSKLLPSGSVVLRTDGKVLKGPDFVEPDIARVLGTGA